MATKLKSGELVACPHCGEAQEEQVDDFVVGTSIGTSSRNLEDCVHCGQSFYVERAAAGTYLVEPA